MIEQIRKCLAVYSYQKKDIEARPRAAVLLPLYDRAGHLHVVLTRRSDQVKHHKGEISLPGGSCEPDDFDLASTALRESEEEIGLQRGHVELIGRLDDVITITSFHVSTYVGCIDPAQSPYPWHSQAEEVAEIIEIPVSHLLDPENRVEFTRERNGGIVTLRGYRFGEHVVWGATGQIIANFLEVISNPETAVVPTGRVSRS